MLRYTSGKVEVEVDRESDLKGSPPTSSSSQSEPPSERSVKLHSVYVIDVKEESRVSVSVSRSAYNDRSEVEG